MRAPKLDSVGRDRLGQIAAAAALAVAAPASLAVSAAPLPDPSCLGRGATIVRGEGPSRIRGTEGRDVIVAGGGDDRIFGLGAADRICAGPGDDRMRGGGGNDRGDGGPGRDKLVGGNGSDRLRGRGGRDRLFGQLGSDRGDAGPGSGERVVGGRGNDRLRGGGGRDHLDGGLGDDLLLGGPGGGDFLVGDLGNDRLHGGPGDGDVVRGDFGRDLMDGGAGDRDLGSFTTAADDEGVVVDLVRHQGRGDGLDRVLRTEDVVGSAFGDLIRGDAAVNRIDGAAGDDRLFGGPPSAAPGDEGFGGGGADVCGGFELTDSCGNEDRPSARDATAVELTRSLDGTALTVRGSDGGDSIRLSRRGGAVVVTDRRGLEPAVSGCVLVSSQVASCPGGRELRFVLVDAGAGGDVVRIGDSIPLTLRIRINGGGGRDLLQGGRGDDVIEGGRGVDRLIGHGGADALVSAFDADTLSGGGGADLLVAAGACTGDRLRGGDGADSASFARVVAGVVRARIGGAATNLSRVRDGGPCRRVRIQGSVENLEGSPGRDVLLGDQRRNILLGRGGGDALLGLGGGDRLVGGGGADELAGGPGADRLYARDGARDRRIDCGAGGSRLQRVTRDRSDPRPERC